MLPKFLTIDTIALTKCKIYKLPMRYILRLYKSSIILAEMQMLNIINRRLLSTLLARFPHGRKLTIRISGTEYFEQLDFYIYVKSILYVNYNI